MQASFARLLLPWLLPWLYPLVRCLWGYCLVHQQHLLTGETLEVVDPKPPGKKPTYLATVYSMACLMKTAGYFLRLVLRGQMGAGKFMLRNALVIGRLHICSFFLLCMQ